MVDADSQLARRLGGVEAVAQDVDRGPLRHLLEIDAGDPVAGLPLIALAEDHFVGCDLEKTVGVTGILGFPDAGELAGDTDLGAPRPP